MKLRRWTGFGFWLAIALCLSPPVHGLPAAAAEPSSVPGPSSAPGPSLGRICDVEIRLDTPLGRAIDLDTLIAFGPGVRITEPAIRRTLSNVYATELVDEAEILTRPCPTPDGEVGPWVTVILALWSKPWVDTVELFGEPGLRPSLIRREILQKASAPLSNELLDTSRRALLELYADRGYLEAMVNVELVERQPGRYDARFRLEPGRRATVGEVHFEGRLDTLPTEALRDEVRSGPGDAFDRANLDGDRERLRLWLSKQGYRDARVEPPRQEYDPERGQVDLVYTLDVGTPLEVEITGATRRRLQKLGLLNFLEDPNLDSVLIQQSCERIASHYQRRGHYRAAVDCALADDALAPQDAPRRLLTIDVDLGPVYELHDIRFEGNAEVRSETLFPLIGTSVKQRFQPSSGHLVTVDVDADLDNLRSYYLLQGYLDAVIGPWRVEENGLELALVIPIDEGERRRVVELTWSGNVHFPTEDIVASVPLRSGGPFHPALLEDSLGILRTLYEDRGYPTATLEPHLDWSDDGTLVDIHVEIREGRQARLDRVILRGHRLTRPEAIHRALGLETGEVLSRRRLLEAERDLYRLGIFSKADVSLAPTVNLQAARDVVVRLEEGRRWRFGYGFSYHSDDGLGGLLSIVRTNIGGRGDRLQFDARGNQAERRYRWIYDQPSFLNTNIPITFILFRQFEDRDTFEVEDTGAQISLAKERGSSRLGLLYDYRLADLSIDAIDFTDDDLADIDREDRAVEISSLTPNLFIDRRDDPLNPTAGWSTNLQLEYAFPFLSAEADFLKLFWQQTTYRPVGRFGGLAASLRLGAIEPLDLDAEADPLVPPELANARIPVSERFFAGGRTSHRAYERDRLGVIDRTLIPRDDDEPLEVGGNGLFVLNLDYRFPISGGFGGTVFFDLGNVWADWEDFDPDDLRPGAGLGVRYASPIGPIRLEIGWKLDPLPHEGSNAVFFLSFGNPF